MQNAKDTFYEVLRARLAAAEPDRTVVVRGVTRPAVLVMENELPAVKALTDCFLLRWGEVAVDTDGALATVTMQCAIEYATAGTGMNGSLDRGRVLTAMDAALLAMLTQEPMNAAKTNYSAALALTTRIWWGEPEMGDISTSGERMQRTATLAVMSFANGGAI